MRIFFACLFLATLTMTSCGGDDDDFLGDCTLLGFNDEADSVVSRLADAVNAYTADQSPVNCEAYRTAANDYVELLERYANCDFVDGDFDDDLEDARRELRDLDCS